MTTQPSGSAAPCPHSRMVDVERLVGVSEASNKGVSWMVRTVLDDGPLWLTRGSKVVAVLHAVRSSDGSKTCTCGPGEACSNDDFSHLLDPPEYELIEKPGERRRG